MLRKIFQNSSLTFRNLKSFASKCADTNDQTRVMLESLTSTLKGIQNINYIEEFDPNLSVEEKAKRKRFLIYRSNPAVSFNTSYI